MRLRDRFIDWRNSWLATREFQEWAVKFPLARPIARVRARELFDINAGFVYSQILQACVSLDVFRIVHHSRHTIASLAGAIGLPEQGTERLVRAAVALKYLEFGDEGRVALGPSGAALLGNPSVMLMVRHHAALYEDLRNPVSLLRERSTDTHLASFWRYGDDASPENNKNAQAYSALMLETQEFIAREILRAYSFKRHKRLMDIGGGAGGFVCAAKKQWPSLDITVCDLEPVAEIANRRFTEQNIEGRAVACDFKNDPLPPGADVISLVRVLHDHDDDVAKALLAKIYDALPAGGSILIAEPMAGTRGAEPIGDAYFGFYLWAMGSGRPRTLSEIRQMLKDAGFAPAKTHRTSMPLFTRALSATKAK